MPSNSPTISAIVLNYKTPHDTLRCVDALQKQTIAEELEIIVIDNHSGDRSMSILRPLLGKIARLSLLETPANLGYGKGNNLGVARARGEYILIINPDTSLEPDALEKMLAYMKEHPEAGILGPKLIFPDGTIRDSFRTFPTLTDIFIKRTPLRFFFPKRMGAYLQWAEDPHEVRQVDWIVGACLFLRKDFFEALGGFDPRFFFFFEDTDLCRRCWKAGKEVIYFAKAHARDSEHRLSEGGFFAIFLKKSIRIHLRSALRYFWKWRKTRAERAVKAGKAEK